VKLLLKISLVLICLFLISLYAATQSGAQAPQTKSKPRSAQTISGDSKEGEKRFRAHCARCHNAPEQLSPGEARTVLRHMRVRAMLSAEDERLILQYLAP
jgi:cytochrome c553